MDENIFFNPWLVESMNVKPRDTGRADYIFTEKKNLYISGHVQFKPVFKGQLYTEM